MNRFRNKLKDGFTTIPNSIVNDREISAKAKGVLLYLASKPDTWRFFMEDIRNHFTDGATAIQSAVKELEKAGYLTRKRVSDTATGKWAGYDWILHDRKNRQTGNPSAGEPISRKSGSYSNTEDSNTDSSNKEVSNNKENGAVAPDELSGILGRLIEQWNGIYGVKVRATGKKRQQLRQRLRTFTLPEIMMAISNRARDPWLQKEGIQYRGDWDAFFRNDERVERYLNAKRYEEEDEDTPLF